jgi:hypothetical protein
MTGGDVSGLADGFALAGGFAPAYCFALAGDFAWMREGVLHFGQ